MNKERQEARNLILLLSSATFIAFLVVVGLVYYFSASGTYLLRDILVSPQTLEKNTFSDYNPQTHRPGKFIYSKMEFVQSDKHGKGWERYLITLKQYARFHELVNNERSVPVVTKGMLDQFQTITPSILTIFVQGGGGEELSSNGKIFQQVQFLEGNDIFRVQFHPLQKTGSTQEEWLYFRYPGIYEQAVEIFVPKKEKSLI